MSRLLRGPAGHCWTIEHQIGCGSFATVWKARDVNNGQVAAVKEICTDKLNEKLKESLASEIHVLERTRHKNIVSLLDLIKVSNVARTTLVGNQHQLLLLVVHVQEEGRIYLVLEYCGGGDLAHYLRRYGRVPESTAWYLLHQLAEGLKMLRMNNLIHVRAHGGNTCARVSRSMACASQAGSRHAPRGTHACVGRPAAEAGQGPVVVPVHALMTNCVHGCMHALQRDLKPQNLLLSDNSRQPVLKIADFGFARNLQPQVSWNVEQHSKMLRPVLLPCSASQFMLACSAAGMPGNLCLHLLAVHARPRSSLDPTCSCVSNSMLFASTFMPTPTRHSTRTPHEHP